MKTRSKITHGEFKLPENFKAIPGHSNYGINEIGQVWSRKTGRIMKTCGSKYRRKDGSQNMEYIRSIVNIQDDSGNPVAINIGKLMIKTYGELKPNDIDKINEVCQYLVSTHRKEMEKENQNHVEESDSEDEEEKILFNLSKQDFIKLDEVEMKIQKQTDDSGYKYFNIFLRYKP